MRGQGLKPDNVAVYGGAFNDAMNRIYSSDNIQSTADAVMQCEPAHGPFEVGKFNRYLLQQTDLPAGVTFDDFEQDFMKIPGHLRKRVSDVLRANFHAKPPLPVHCTVGANLDDTHDVIIRNFELNNQV